MGPMLQYQGARARNRYPCLLLEEGRGWFLKWKEGKGALGGLMGLAGGKVWVV